MTWSVIVGGPHDGEWTEDVRGETLQKHVLKPMPLCIPDDPPEMTTVDIATYTRRKWRCGDKQWLIWAPRELSDIDVMNRLLRGYRPARMEGEEE
jgi:hypothetical protein